MSYMAKALTTDYKRDQELISFYLFEEKGEYVFTMIELIKLFDISSARIYQILKKNHIRQRSRS